MLKCCDVRLVAIAALQQDKAAHPKLDKATARKKQSKLLHAKEAVFESARCSDKGFRVRNLGVDFDPEP